MRIERRLLLGFAALLLSLLSTSGVAYARHPTVRWDIVSIDFSTTPPTLTAGGIGSARANDNSKITLTGSGTFRDKPGNRHAEGGGTWTTFAPDGNVTGSGTYEVTGVANWVPAPGTLSGLTDRIGNPAEASAGLVVLTIEYSDGDEGTLVVSCRVEATPDTGTVFEGITATKGFAGYWNRESPVPGVDANRTLFHVTP